jgi:hypothetical protein
MMMLAAIATPWPARAQSSADEPLEVPVHPAVTTVIHLPDEIEHARFTARVAGTMQATHSGHLLTVRPQRRVRAGMVVSLEVKTATVRARFRLRVVRRARDARKIIVVPAAEPVPSAGAPAPDDDALDRSAAAPDHEPAAPGDQVVPSARTPEPAARTPEPAATAPRAVRAPEPAATAPHAVRVPAQAGPIIARVADKQRRPVTATVTASAPRFELTVHALVALPGFTSLELAGTRPSVSWRPHLGLGVRLAAGPTNSWWDVEADVSGTWLTGALTYDEQRPPNRIDVSGPWLRAEVGARARVGARWRPSVYAGLGTQAHLRWTKGANGLDRLQTAATMEDGVVLALGIGLHRRIGDVLLGLDVQVRRGGPDDYHSMTALWTVGYFLDPGGR